MIARLAFLLFIFELDKISWCCALNKNRFIEKENYVLNDKNENFELKRKESYSEEPQATDSFIEV
jgi:hypothetical protein